MFSFVALACVCACGATPHGSPAKKGHVSVAASVDPKLARKGTLFTYWMTKAEYDQVMSGSQDLTPLARLLDRLRLVGEVDLSAGAAEYPIPEEGPDIVVSAVLDTQHDGIGSLLGAALAPDGDLMGDSKPGSYDIALDQVARHSKVESESCSGANHELVTLDAPEVAGAMGNPTARRACVILPASYATGTRRYPVVYEFPGWGGDIAHYIKGYKHDALFAAAAPEAILVLVDTSTRSGSSYLVDSPRTGQWDTFLAKRLIPAIDQRYRTIATREGRGTVGLSTGGGGSLMWGLRHGELIGVVGAAAPDGPDIEKWLFGPPMPAWTLAMLRVEAATGGAGFFASYGNDWSPDDSPRGWVLPVDLATGKVVPEVAAKWREHGSPSAWLDDPARAAQIKQAFDGNLCLVVGKKDEFGLYPALQDFADKLSKLGIRHDMRLADGGHIDPNVMTLAYQCLAAHLAH
jgi:enterochelin esterase-like enzyme